ncbi:MAG TPA: GMC oxidoreductase [Solirubrobacteraceae bacterium]|jgi:choline dehydrogenase-like flavoprotein
MAEDVTDFVVVGSGPAGAMAAQTLVDSGASVTMVDVGFDAPEKRMQVPSKDYLDIRREEKDQYRYLIGESAEGVGWTGTAETETVTPPRRHITRDVARLVPVASDSFVPFESLGYGGLGIGWGLGCWQFSPSELRACGLDAERMRDAYRVVGQRIGISAAHDDLGEYAVDAGEKYQQPPEMDDMHTLLFKRYERRRATLRENGFALGRPALALLTEDREDRSAYQYHDMDFYADLGRSAWRPWMTVDALRRGGRLAYRSNVLVTRFSERDDAVSLDYVDAASGAAGTLRCRRVLIAASALGSARIVMRSRAPEIDRLPLLCNPYSYIPCIVPSMVGRGPQSRRVGFAQLALIHDPRGDHSDVAMAALYSYQSLMLFRIVRQAPLNFRDAAEILRYFMTGFVIMGMQFPDHASAAKYVSLEPCSSSPTGDRLRANWRDDEGAADARLRRRKHILGFMRKLGAYPVRAIDPGPGTSIHYAGTLPFSEQAQPGGLTPDGRVHGTRSVYVADSAGFRYLPAKGHTWSIMANAHLTAESALRGV